MVFREWVEPFAFEIDATLIGNEILRTFKYIMGKASLRFALCSKDLNTLHILKMTNTPVQNFKEL